MVKTLGVQPLPDSKHSDKRDERRQRLARSTTVRTVSTMKTRTRSQKESKPKVSNDDTESFRKTIVKSKPITDLMATLGKRVLVDLMSITRKDAWRAKLTRKLVE